MENYTGYILKFKIPKGWTAYIMTLEDVKLIFKGFGICDDCGSVSPIGCYVPILNHYMCFECFEDWIKHCEFYEEDLPYEKRNIDFLEKQIKENKFLRLFQIKKLKGE